MARVLSAFMTCLIYFLTYIFLFASFINFFLPITLEIAITIIFFSLLLAYYSIFSPTLESLLTDTASMTLPWAISTIFITVFFLWLIVVLNRPTVGDDAIAYHLPLSLLINQSVWYPGIGKLSSHFGFANGLSTIASVFTAFGVLGLENAPNIITSIILSMGLFLYLVQHGISMLLSIIIMFIFVLCPDVFWQSYNMGTDLPAACFLAFGLLTFRDKRYHDSFFFLALSSIFKPLATLSFLMAIPYMIFLYIKKRQKLNIFNLKLLLAVLLFAVSIARIYIATGNPIYPAWPIDIAPWGISIDLQNSLINGTSSAHITDPGLRYYSGIERSLSGYLTFIVDFIFRPHIVRSSYWFSPFLASCSAFSLYFLYKERIYHKISINIIYLLVTTIFLLSVWLYYSPLFRFIAGVFIFINIKAFIFAQKRIINLKPFCLRYTIHISICVTLLLFIFNVRRHINDDIIPLITQAPESVSKWMPWIYGSDNEKFTIESTEDGFVYSKSTTTYCHRMRSPCLSSRSLADPDILIKEYRKYNHL